MPPPDALTNLEPGLARAWHPVCLSSELQGDPLRVLLLGQPWVLARLGASEILAAPDVCPHRRVPLSAGRIVGDELECAYHGWRFASDGACTAVPALGPDASVPRGMAVRRAYGVVEHLGLVWLAPEEPLTGLPDFPECASEHFAWALLPAVRTTASAGVVIDNFFDVAHFSYLHGATFGVTEPVTVEEHTVTRDGWSARLVHATQVREEVGGLRRVATYTMTAPFAMHLELCFPATGASNMVAFVAVPESATSTVIRKLVAWPAAEGAAALQEQVDAEVAILAEDLAMLELIEDPALPLDLKAELHTKADRPAVELRRLLADFVSAG